jgi:hypothetical protein
MNDFRNIHYSQYGHNSPLFALIAAHSEPHRSAGLAVSKNYGDSTA